MKVNISTLKGNLSKYLRAARAGKTVVVTDRNEPIAKIVPFAAVVTLEKGPEPELPMSKGNGERLCDIPRPKIHVPGATARFLADRE
jgi:prevent-host-death family protein